MAQPKMSPHTGHLLVAATVLRTSAAVLAVFTALTAVLVLHGNDDLSAALGWLVMVLGVVLLTDFALFVVRRRRRDLAHCASASAAHRPGCSSSTPGLPAKTTGEQVAQPRTRLADIDRLAAAETALRLKIGPRTDYLAVAAAVLRISAAVLSVFVAILAVLVLHGNDDLSAALAWLVMVLGVVLLTDFALFVVRRRRRRDLAQVSALHERTSRSPAWVLLEHTRPASENDR